MFGPPISVCAQPAWTTTQVMSRGARLFLLFERLCNYRIHGRAVADIWFRFVQMHSQLRWSPASAPVLPRFDHNIHRHNPTATLLCRSQGAEQEVQWAGPVFAPVESECSKFRAPLLAGFQSQNSNGCCFSTTGRAASAPKPMRSVIRGRRSISPLKGQ